MVWLFFSWMYFRLASYLPGETCVCKTADQLTTCAGYSCLSSTSRMDSHGLSPKTTGDMRASVAHPCASSYEHSTAASHGVRCRAYHLFTDFQLQRLALRGVSCSSANSAACLSLALMSGFGPYRVSWCTTSSFGC